MPRITRRGLLWLGGAALLGLAGARFGVPLVMRRRPWARLSEEAVRFAEACFSRVDRSRIWDAHAHLIGLGAGGTGCWINPEMRSHAHPVKRLQFEIYREAIGMTDEASADADYVARLLDLHRSANPKGKLTLMAFDMNVAPDGTERPELSPFFTPNAYALALARKHEAIVPVASIHPYRLDAVERLDAATEGGARAVKWLPNAMGIDPASARCDAFLERLVALRLPLIVHGGREYAVDASHDQDLGNPLRLRRPLDAGVRVVVAHCASLGRFPDLDTPESARREEGSFELFMRLFTDPGYERNLYGDISTLTHVHHDPEPLRLLLRSPELHSRLLYGSDYPMSALRFMISPARLRLAGLLTATEARLCRELFESNPLLFDLAVMLSVREEVNGRIHRFSPEVFETARFYT